MKILFVIVGLILSNMVQAQFKFPEKIERSHPRLMSPDITKEQILQEIKNSPEVKNAYGKFKSRIAGYVKQYETDPEWMASRLQMYWKSHATDVFIKGEFYSHAEGKAPVPTVRFTGSRDNICNYNMPSTEDVLPYMDDERGLWVQNKTTKKWEWAEQSKTGRVVENINQRIMEYARDAALVYFIEGDTRYAKFATHLFDVYMHGIYYRNVPYDIEHGNIQNLVGYTSFQVIKEGVVDPLASCYDYLYGYLKENAKDEIPIYSTSFKKMAEQIIKNGVPDNNWNLIQANIVLQVAFILEDDSKYEDGRGCQYYLDRIFNKTEARQWGITKLLNQGYDPHNGIWEECAGYSMGVTKDFTSLMITIQDAVNIDILPDMPVLPKAVNVLPQYMFPNKYVVAFGDTHYGKVSPEAIFNMVRNARKFGKADQEKKYTAMALMINNANGDSIDQNRRSRNAFMSLLTGNGTVLDRNIQPANINDYVTPTFYAPNVSWLALRNGFDSKHGLMISQAGSLGNHMHSNGIAMELYGKNYVLGVEGGRGSSYFQPDYLEYYSQFPAHNTVSVNGISQYKAMKSEQPFKMNAVYPQSERKTGYYPGISFSDLYFLEPKTNADQTRLMGVVRTGKTSGYYIDIFRSKCKAGNDKYHDYFYHNIGQKLTLSDTKNELLALSPSKQLSSAEGDIKAYDYISDKESVKTDQDFRATFELNIPGEERVSMNMWMRGDVNREIFKVKTPHSEAMRDAMIPNDIAKMPLLTTIVRNNGEAWKHPFVAVYEPTTESEPATIKNITSFKANGASDAFVGLKIESLSNRTDYIFSSDTFTPCTFQNISFSGTFGIVTKELDKTTLFLGSGNAIKNEGYSIKVKENGSSSATLEYNSNTIHLTTDSTIVLTIPDKYKKGEIVLCYGSSEIKGERQKDQGIESVRFTVPAIPYQEVKVKIKK
ncbi:: hypothetical protein [Arcticibacter svalbardensis MN12-7]|uniref:Heparinase II/III-like protein n=1 Tax=Arcticibacter svalbardensis MN12-7 TaxID=1150600 RepID=R9GRL1_9SPHI|nr:heparinase II/III family protein [Arcticibacter svalbardensis]EOR94487.1 : hypothetical protein [Arcticibacter svalbardensis MN12-7]